MSTIHGRLRKGRETLEKDQAQFAEALDMSQSAYSKRETGFTKVTFEQLQKLEMKFGLSTVWVLTGDGHQLIPKVGETQEPVVVYFDWSINSFRARFQQAIKEYQEQNGIKSQKIVSERLHIGETFLSKVMNDSKDVSVEMLINAHRYGNFNLNYIAGAVGGVFIGDNNYSDKKRIAELEERVDELKQLVALLKGQKNIEFEEGKKERA